MHLEINYMNLVSETLVMFAHMFEYVFEYLFEYVLLLVSMPQNLCL